MNYPAKLFAECSYNGLTGRGVARIKREYVPPHGLIRAEIVGRIVVPGDSPEFDQWHELRREWMEVEYAPTLPWTVDVHDGNRVYQSVTFDRAIVTMFAVNHAVEGGDSLELEMQVLAPYPVELADAWKEPTTP